MTFVRKTGVNKRKYKLAFNVIRDIQIYPFFVLNSKKNFSGRYAFEIEHKDWAIKSWGTSGKPCLSRQASYIDVRKMEMIRVKPLNLRNYLHNLKKYWHVV